MGNREEMVEAIYRAIEHFTFAADADRIRKAIASSLPAPSLSTSPAMAETLLRGPFQDRVKPWMLACFGPNIPYDRTERGDRLLEEVFELLQSGGYDPARVLELRDYTWGRAPGEPRQEVGGVMVTLAAYCLAHGLNMHEAGEVELARIWTKVEAIRAKQAAKPRGIALPIDPAALPSPAAGQDCANPVGGAQPLKPAWMLLELQMAEYLDKGWAIEERGQRYRPPTPEERSAVRDFITDIACHLAEDIWGDCDAQIATLAAGQDLTGTVENGSTPLPPMSMGGGEDAAGGGA
jgi:hypothetical protein